MRSLSLALLLVLTASLGGAAQAPGETYTVECVLSNPAYSGRCTVSEEATKASTPKQACETVLSCLNDARCSKTYCNATTIRGGWKLEESREKK